MPRFDDVKTSNISVRNGKMINTDIPEEDRRRVSAKKSKSRSEINRKRKRLQEQKDKELLEKEAKYKGVKIRRKRKKPVDSDAPKKKRKRKTTGDLLLAGKAQQARKRLMSLSKSVAIHPESEVEEVVIPTDLLESVTTESQFLEEYRHIYSTLGNIIRKLEERMQDPNSKYGVSSKDVYALMTMYSQMRETIADMRSIKDMNAQAEALAINVFDPVSKSSGEALINIYYKVSKSIRHNVKDLNVQNTILEKLKQDMAVEASELQNQLGISRQKIVETLTEG